MLKKYPFIKWSLLGLLGLLIAIFAFGFWFISLLSPIDKESQLPSTLPKDLHYLSSAPQLIRGKILAVVTSHDTMGKSGKKTGYELTELARSYYVFQANGFEVDVASPKGGNPPIIIDEDDMSAFDYAFLNDSVAQRKSTNTLALNEVNAEDYMAIYFVGGKGAMFDFPNNKYIQSIIQKFDETNKVVGAVCHGPSALTNVKLADGTKYLAGKKVCGFTNTEEYFLIPDANDIFPFLLQDKLTEQGADFQEGQMYLKNVVKDGNLITGQNPWSTWAVAETMVKQLGSTPKERKHTAEENTIDILANYQLKGYESGIKKIDMILEQNGSIDRMLLGMHFIVATMKCEFGDMIDFIRFLTYTKNKIHT